MRKVADFLNICVSMPNMGSFIFYIIFVFLTPIFLLVINQESSILTYLPLLVPLAIIMHTVGKDRVFQNLYPKKNDNTTGVVSKYIINTIAMIAIFAKVTMVYRNSNELLAVGVGLINMALIFIVAPFVFPLALDSVDEKVKEFGWSTRHEWHKYTVGFLMIIAIIIVELLLGTIMEMLIQ